MQRIFMQEFVEQTISIWGKYVSALEDVFHLTTPLETELMCLLEGNDD